MTDTILAGYELATLPALADPSVRLCVSNLAAPKAATGFGLTGLVLAWEDLTGESVEIECASDALALSILGVL